MAELLLNWAMVLATFAALFLIAWWGYRDLQGQSKVESRRSKVPPPTAFDLRPSTFDDDDEAPQALHRLRIEYRRDGETRHVQWVTDEWPGFIGTQEVPGMGAGILVRHARVFYEDGGFRIENRHSTQPIGWWVENHHNGDLPPGGLMPLGPEIDLFLGDWTLHCTEE